MDMDMDMCLHIHTHMDMDMDMAGTWTWTWTWTFACTRTRTWTWTWTWTQTWSHGGFCNGGRGVEGGGSDVEYLHNVMLRWFTLREVERRPLFPVVAGDAPVAPHPNASLTAADGSLYLGTSPTISCNLPSQRSATFRRKTFQ